mmetsp:Transcript_7546/g.18847  ORF Transcript_7546/g.18847 Transcript_7546/m.18847 type:complete len:131 (-) Transcript_7546:283-675(-)|eukprot:CAMPEP_0172391160 /NCGR_PEP_ID=MMETSP1061-20121228/7624_1 /TAXON_ID=37318 /ORGANISM="Pseudo-nitzschia pungens, Strain cf. pungens" /LENGTH=130 /DNA_ID=CAMNT_0013121703 /DNA_START=162 /DNA_END=554 /DNA_ORIENTATION=-
MAKSIRSKCKRKARSEFRATIGNEFYKKNMEKVQAKLKECAETQTMTLGTLERLSSALHTTTAEEGDDAMVTGEQTSILNEELAAAKELKGENKAPSKTVHKKSKKSKHRKTTTIPDKKEKKRPRYFVQF